MLRLFRIDGVSLYPHFREGEVVICRKLYAFNKIKVNNFVLFKHEDEGMMIKRVSHINEKGFYVKGENPFSRDSRDFGELQKEQLLYKVFMKL